MKDDVFNRLKVKRGSELPQSKLCESQVSEILGIVERRDKIKKELALMTNKVIALKYGVHQRTIDRITAGENWTHV